MTLLVIMTLLVLAVVFGVFFLFFKILWLIFKKNTNVGPLIGATVCTLGCALLLAFAVYTGYKAVITPFQDIIANVKANPAPIYGERTYLDDQYPFALTVYDGMDFSKWITLGKVQFKLGIDTNVFKKDSAGKSITDTSSLAAILVHQTDATEDSFAKLQKQFSDAQNQQLEITSQSLTEVNGFPAYQASGEINGHASLDSENGFTSDAASHKLPFWLMAVQTEPTTVYYIAVFALDNMPELDQQAQQIIRSFKLVQPSN